MARGRTAAVVVGLLVVASACGWPQARFDAGRTANNTFERAIGVANVASLVPGWSISGDQIFGETVVQSGQAVTQDRTRVLVVDAATGTPRWSAPLTPRSDATTTLAAGVGTARTADGRDVVLSADHVIDVVGHPQGDGGQLAAYDAKTGARLWTQPIAPLSAPLVVGPTVFVISSVRGFGGPSFYGLVALDVATGTIQFRAPGAFGPSLAAVGQLIVVGTDSGFGVLPADGCGAATCSVAWSGVGAGRFGSAIAISNGTIFTASDGGLEAYPADGCGVRTCAPAWRVAGSFAALAIGQGFVFVTATNDGNPTVMSAIPETGCGTATCRAVWTSSESRIYTAPSVANGVVYAGANDGSLRAWPAAGCGTNACPAAWSTVVPDVVANATVADGRLYVPSLTLRTFTLPPA